MGQKVEENEGWESGRIIYSKYIHEEDNIDVKHNLRNGNAQKEQVLTEINRKLQDSLILHIIVNVKLYDLYEQLQVIGIVEQIDHSQGRFMVSGDWFALSDIEDIAGER